MARYIDADKFAERIRLSPAFKNTGFEGDLLQRVVLDLLENAPTADVVEVVRCEKCIHKFDIDGRCMCSLNATESFGKWYGLVATRNEHFCGYGERR